VLEDDLLVGTLDQSACLPYPFSAGFSCGLGVAGDLPAVAAVSPVHTHDKNMAAPRCGGTTHDAE